jgi:fluoride ion exporter CrcB/FEX
MQRCLLVIILILFGALTGTELWQYSYWSLIAPQFQNFGLGQVLADLTISLILIMIWMWQDAKTTGRNPWPWLVATLTLGSFGPLIYLLTRKSIQEKPQ